MPQLGVEAARRRGFEMWGLFFMSIKTGMGWCGIDVGDVFLLGEIVRAFFSMVGEEENGSVEDVADGDDEEGPPDTACKEARG